jgi:hypothetical protein
VKKFAALLLCLLAGGGLHATSTPDPEETDCETTCVGASQACKESVRNILNSTDCKNVRITCLNGANCGMGALNAVGDTLYITLDRTNATRIPASGKLEVPNVGEYSIFFFEPTQGLLANSKLYFLISTFGSGRPVPEWVTGGKDAVEHHIEALTTLVTPSEEASSGIVVTVIYVLREAFDKNRWIEIGSIIRPSGGGQETIEYTLSSEGIVGIGTNSIDLRKRQLRESLMSIQSSAIKRTERARL